MLKWGRLCGTIVSCWAVLGATVMETLEQKELYALKVDSGDRIDLFCDYDVQGVFVFNELQQSEVAAKRLSAAAKKACKISIIRLISKGE